MAQVSITYANRSGNANDALNAADVVLQLAMGTVAQDLYVVLLAILTVSMILAAVYLCSCVRRVRKLNVYTIGKKTGRTRIYSHENPGTLSADDEFDCIKF